jgi:uncharacterized protein (TIGR03437 family)
VDVSRNLNRLALLALLTCGGSWAQTTTVPVRVGLSIPGAVFLVDGQAYTSSQILNWTVGSNHQIFFLQTAEPDGSFSVHQYPSTPGFRYTFGGWTVTGQPNSGLGGPLVNVTVGPNLTDVLGAVSEEVALYVYFSGFTDPSLACSAVPVPSDPREGVITVGSACFSSPAMTWIAPGSIDLTAAPFPGFFFTSWSINGNTFSTPSFTYNMVVPSSITATFQKAKRVRFRSNPLGLNLLVDQQLLKPGPLVMGPYSGDPYCPIDYSLLPINFPVGYVPLCVGDFDYPPGSKHVLAAPEVQTDTQGIPWVFMGFSNGLGQGGIYTADSNVDTVDSVFANFSRGVLTQVVTSPPGLKVNVDSQDDSTGTRRTWTDGQNHHLIAPPTQTDASGHAWKFVSWSNNGSADQVYTVPTGLTTLTMTATYELAGKLQVVSVPSGLPIRIDGSVCNTPCVISDKPTGAQVQVLATASISPDASRRYDFKSWNPGNTSNALVVTIADQSQIFTATYQAYYKLSTASRPLNEAVFTTDPASTDGFFADRTQVAVTVIPQNGFSFRQWSGDLSGGSTTSALIMNNPRAVVAVMDSGPFITGITNAAGDTPSLTVGPGSDISILGGNLADGTQVAPAGLASYLLAGASAYINTRPLPLLFVSPEQINAQVFSDLEDGWYTLTIRRTGQPDVSKDVNVHRYSPGLFQWYPAQGAPTVAAFREDGSMLTASNPAARTETISIYGTGFGLYEHLQINGDPTSVLIDGYPTPATGDWNVQSPVTVTVGGQTYTPVSARAANGLIGMVVVKFKLTTAVPAGLADLKVSVGGADSNTTKLPLK